MNAREDILTAIRDRGPASRERPRVPDFSQGPADLAGLFTAALARLDGQAIPPPPAGLQTWLAATFPDATQICSAVPEVTGTITPHQFPDWAAPADIDVTVVRSPLGVAETGSILLTEKELGVNTIAVLAQHLIVLLDPADLVENIHQAYRHPQLPAGCLRGTAVRAIGVSRHRRCNGPPGPGRHHPDCRADPPHLSQFRLAVTREAPGRRADLAGLASLWRVLVHPLALHTPQPGRIDPRTASQVCAGGT